VGMEFGAKRIRGFVDMDLGPGRRGGAGQTAPPFAVQTGGLQHHTIPECPLSIVFPIRWTFIVSRPPRLRGKDLL